MTLPRLVKRDGPLAGLVLLLCVVLFPRALVRGELFFERDLHVDWYPRIASISRSLASGAWPLWDPFIGFGQPLLADPGAQVAYPATWLALVLPVSAGYTAFVVLHLLLTAVGAARLARAVGAGRVGAGAAALLWVLSGPLQSSVNLWHHFAGVAWMPWVLLAVDRAARGPSLGAAARLAAALGIQVLAGSADACAMTLVLGAAWAFVRLAARPAHRRRAAPALGTLAGALVVAVGLTAVVWWPAADVLSRSPRRDLPEDVRTAWSVPPAGLLRLVAPLDPARVPVQPGTWERLYGGSRPPLLPSLYLGPVLLVASLAGLGWKRARRRAGLLLAGATAALGFAMGPYGPVYPALVELVPLLRIFRYPSKAALAAALLLSLAAGLGVAAVRRGALRAVLAGLLLAGAALAALAAPRWGASVPGPSVALAAAAAIALALAARGRVGRGLAAVSLGVLGVADLAAVHAGMNPTAPASLLLVPPPLVAHVDRSEGRRLYVYDYHSLPESSPKWLGRDRPYARLAPPPGWDRRTLAMVALRLYLLPPAAGFYGLEGSYDLDLRGLFPRDLNDLTFFLRRVEGQPAHAKLLRMGAVGTVASLHDGGFGEPVATLASLFPEPIRVWRVPEAPPRSWVVGCARQADRGAAFAALLDPAFDPAGEVVLPEPAPGGSGCGPAGRSLYLRPQPDRVRLEVEAERDGYVVVADAFDPGWRASVDGAAAPVLRANVAFRAVPVPAGRHVVEMIYRPRAVSRGATLTVLFLVLLAATATAALRSRRARER
jgi:hypothetical protein